MNLHFSRSKQYLSSLISRLSLFKKKIRPPRKLNDLFQKYKPRINDGLKRLNSEFLELISKLKSLIRGLKNRILNNNFSYSPDIPSIWIWCMTIIPLLFIVWSVWLIVSANDHRRGECHRCLGSVEARPAPILRA